MRQVKGLAPGRLIPFVPTAFDNEKDISPIEMDILIPTEGERRKILARSAQLVVSKGEDAEVSIEATLDIQERTVRDFVKHVRNYKDAAGNQIENGEDLVNNGETVFILQAYQAISDPMLLTDQEKKASKKLPGSTSQDTPVSTGIAASV